MRFRISIMKGSSDRSIETRQKTGSSWIAGKLAIRPVGGAPIFPASAQGRTINGHPYGCRGADDTAHTSIVLPARRGQILPRSPGAGRLHSIGPQSGRAMAWFMAGV